MEIPRNNNSNTLGLSESIKLQALAEGLKSFNALLEGGSIPFDKVIDVAKIVIPQLCGYYEGLILTLVRK